MTLARLKHFGRGREGEGLMPSEEAYVLGRIEQRFGWSADDEVKPPKLEDIKLEPPRLDPPASLPFCSTGHYDRAAHAYGKSFPDYAGGLVGDYRSAPDVVAYPRNEEEVAAVLDWAGGAQASVTPFGGGSSVVGGVEPKRDAVRYTAAVTVDLRELGRVLEVDKTSRAARIQAGAFGPALETQLKPHGLTLRHFPQSFECSTLGGWIATRSGGHFATLHPHRRSGGIASRHYPEGRDRDASATWLGRRPKPQYGQTHDIKNLFVSDGSQFTTSAACNPTLTIVTLAIRQADHIAGAMQRGEI